MRRCSKNKPDISKAELKAALTAKFLRLFMPLDDNLGKMHRHGASDRAYLSAQFAQGQKIAATLSSRSKALLIQDLANYEQYLAEAVFIPTKEVLSLVKGMTDESHDQGTVELIFDDGYVDLAKAMMKAGHEDIAAQVNLDPRLNAIIPQLVDLIGGRYQWENGGFCFQAGKIYGESIPEKNQSKSSSDVSRLHHSRSLRPRVDVCTQVA